MEEADEPAFFHARASAMTSFPPSSDVCTLLVETNRAAELVGHARANGRDGDRKTRVQLGEQPTQPLVTVIPTTRFNATAEKGGIGCTETVVAEAVLTP